MSQTRELSFNVYSPLLSWRTNSPLGRRSEQTPRSAFGTFPREGKYISACLLMGVLIQRLLFTFVLADKLPTGEAFRVNAPVALWSFLAREKGHCSEPLHPFPLPRGVDFIEESRRTEGAPQHLDARCKKKRGEDPGGLSNPSSPGKMGRRPRRGGNLPPVLPIS